MTDVMVSVRMPETLLIELQELVEEHHYLDLSEEIRSIVRKQWMKSTKPELSEMKALRSTIEKELHQLTQKRIQEEVNKELKKIRHNLSKGGSHE